MLYCQKSMNTLILFKAAKALHKRRSLWNGFKDPGRHSPKGNLLELRGRSDRLPDTRYPDELLTPS